MVTISIIGAGRLGKTLATDLHRYNIAKVNGICNASWKSSCKTVKTLGFSTPYHHINELPGADYLFITTPDDIIQDIVSQLTAAPNVERFKTVIHCSGALSSSHLNPLLAYGTYIASLHPMKSFSSNSRNSLKNTYCAIEGDLKAVDSLKLLMQPLSLKFLDIDSSKKTLYHIGGVFSSNLLISLIHSACICFERSGIPRETAVNISAELIHSTLSNINISEGFAEALTGPIARGDTQTIKGHLEQMPKSLEQTYIALSKNLIDISNLTIDKQNQINQLLRLIESNE